LKKKIEVTITSMAGGKGDGVAFHDGITLFIPFAVSGDVVEVSIETNGKKRWARPKNVKLISPSPFRRKPICPYHPDLPDNLESKCGGCPLMALLPEKQQEEKLAIANRALRQVKGEFVPPESILSNGPELGYRSRARFRWKNGKFGLNAPSSKIIVPINQCPVTTFSKLIPQLLKILPKKHDAEIRITENPQNQLLLNLSSKQPITTPSNLMDIAKKAGISGLNWNGKLFGEKFINMSEENDPVFYISAGGFSQAGLWANNLIKGQLILFLEKIGTQKNIVELYAGSGNLTSILTKYGSVTACDPDPTSHDAFLLNLGKKVKFLPIAAEQISISKEVSLLVLDPPRTGISTKAMDIIKESKTEFIILFSCDPMTGMRDISALLASNWKVDELVLLNTMPNTPHFEMATLFRKSNRV
jgi:23S rRNA (uracil1939-C5)-methyltransferase